jgi:DNA-damage-inducible protein D
MLKSAEIKELFVQFENAAAEIEGIECWSARELQKLLGYALWQNFEKVLAKAKEACENVGEKVSNHFIDINKMVEIGSGILYERGVDNAVLHSVGMPRSVERCTIPRLCIP